MIELHLPVLPPVVLLLAALLVPLCGAFRRGSAYAVALAAVGAACGFSLFGLVRVLALGPLRYHLGGWLPPAGIEYTLDTLSAFMVAVITSLALAVLVYAHASVRRELPEREVAYYSVVMLLMAGFTGIILTGDVFNLYVFLEIASLAGYALVAVGDRKAPVAAFRYLLLGTLGASFYLLGVGFLYMMTGSLNMAHLSEILPDLLHERAIIVAAVLMVTGIGIKMAMFPLHGWLPDAYTHAPSASSALLGALGTKVAAYMMIRILFFVFEPEYIRSMLPLSDIIAWLSAAGIVFGSVMAVAQKELKRMLAYSSVSQIGYIGLGIGMASPLGFIGAVLHILNHAAMKACLFLVAGNLRRQCGHSTIPQFDRSLRRRMPWTMAAFSLTALSMIGVPPTAGFFSKWYLVLAGIEASNWAFVLVILASSLLAAVYFFRILENVYLRSGAEETGRIGDGQEGSREVAPSMLVPTLVLAVAVLVLGILNVYFVKLIRIMIPAAL